MVTTVGKTVDVTVGETEDATLGKHHDADISLDTDVSGENPVVTSE